METYDVFKQGNFDLTHNTLFNINNLQLAISQAALPDLEQTSQRSPVSVKDLISPGLVNHASFLSQMMEQLEEFICAHMTCVAASAS